ncbi:DNA-directed primase/polymerase protein [Selaginella moellendorffii]|uniref:DNA-directed primase/polymerase protein n=1 Tax=Selaginella moellendorffii TaxID=88036 RepID=UPI000D1CD5CA|nr:DNA-directed primase/polymerase protein [Selaginella moellendorffii]|eukprot:XP_024523407.1 DNA-directed primase/polymerase protein [Selaginella moellendorffii]
MACPRNEQRPREIAAGIFYGAPRGGGHQQPPRLLHLLRDIRSDLGQESTPIAAGDAWATFARQEQALQYADCHRHGLAVFTYQDHTTGQRRFLVTSHLEFWRRYEKMHGSLRHHYEIIRENTPCNLYFDLEFNRHTNQGADGDAMVDLLLQLLASTLYEAFSIRYNMAWTLELDSSTADKFSRHLILRIPNTAFRDNSHAGEFVAHLCSRIHVLRGRDKHLEELYVITDHSSTPRLFVDQAVYSRNRCFRLVFSAKAGKTAILVPTYRFASSSEVVMDDITTFMQALVCNVDANCETLLTFDRGAAGKHPKSLSNIQPQHSVASEASPFGAVDAFVESISSFGNTPGKIRNWFWFSELGIIVYNISGNRFCERVGRQHKSNNVMYIVNLRRASYYQKCHDPDCRGYKSPVRPVPCHVLPPAGLHTHDADTQTYRR